MNDSEIHILDHLRELRRRMIYVVIAILCGFTLCYLVKEPIYQFLVAPLADAMKEGSERRLIYTGLTEAFFMYLKLALWAGFILAFPFVAWQLYRFVAPGLYKNERSIMRYVLLAAPALFILGSALAYYFIFPLAWEFFLGYEAPADAGGLAIQLEARVSEYLSLVTALIMGFGLAFQMPLILVLMVRSGFLTVAGLRSKRRHAIVGIFALAAIVTPPDVISQIGLAIPLVILYEAAIFVCRYVEPQNA